MERPVHEGDECEPRHRDESALCVREGPVIPCGSGVRRPEKGWGPMFNVRVSALPFPSGIILGK